MGFDRIHMPDPRSRRWPAACATVTLVSPRTDPGRPRGRRRRDSKRPAPTRPESILRDMLSSARAALPLLMLVLVWAASEASAADARAGMRSCRPPNTSTVFGIDRSKRLVVRSGPYSCRDARRFTRLFARSCGERRRRSGDCTGAYGAPRGRAQCTEQIVGPPGSGGYARERCRIEIRDGGAVAITFYAAFGL
jgi:hypothetical protein